MLGTFIGGVQQSALPGHAEAVCDIGLECQVVCVNVDGSLPRLWYRMVATL